MGNSSSQDNQYLDAKVMEQEELIKMQNKRISDLSESLERVNNNSKQKDLDRQQNSRIQMIQDTIVDSESNNASIISELSNSLKNSLVSQAAVAKNMQSQSATLSNQWKSQSATLQNWQKESKAWRDKVQSQLNINSDSVASNVARIKGLDSSIANNAKSITGLNENVNTKFSALSGRVGKVEGKVEDNIGVLSKGIAINAENIKNMNTRVNGMDTQVKDMSMFMLKNVGEIRDKIVSNSNQISENARGINLNKSAVKNLVSELKLPGYAPIPVRNITMSDIKPPNYDHIRENYLESIRNNRNTKEEIKTNFTSHKNIEYGTLYNKLSLNYMDKYNMVKNGILDVLDAISKKLLIKVGVVVDEVGVDIKSKYFNTFVMLLEDNGFLDDIKSELLKQHELDITGKTDAEVIVFLVPVYKKLAINVIKNILEKKYVISNEKDINILLNDFYEGIHVLYKIETIHWIIYQNENKE